MTIPEFLEQLRQTEGPWALVGTAIRCGQHCPLTAVANAAGFGFKDDHDWTWAGESLGFAHCVASEIAHEADLNRSTDLRAQLLAATVNR